MFRLLLLLLLRRSQQKRGGLDGSSNLSSCPEPPPEVEAVRRALELAEPALATHFVCTWAQLNVTGDGGDVIEAHVDRRGWGDIVVVYTTETIEVHLHPTKVGTVHFHAQLETRSVRAGNVYLLMGLGAASNGIDLVTSDLNSEREWSWTSVEPF